MRAILRQTADCFHTDFNTATPRNAVQHNRQTGSVRNSLEMGINSILRRFIVIGAHLERSVYSHLFRFLGHMDSFCGGISARSRNNLNTASRDLHGQFYYPQVFFYSQGGGFSRGTDSHNAGHAGSYLRFHKHSKSLFIDPIAGKRSHNCCIKTLKLHNLTWKYTILTDTFCHDRIQKYGTPVRHPEIPFVNKWSKTPGRN